MLASRCLFQRLCNQHQNALDVVKHLVVPEPQHAPALRLQPPITLSIVRRPVVLPAIAFDDQAGPDAHQIGHVRPQGQLSTELGVHQLSAAQALPQGLLGVGALCAQRAGERRLLGLDAVHGGVQRLNPHPSPLPGREREEVISSRGPDAR
jgi:hypothetical protein